MSRFIFLLYGIISYVAFLFSFLWAVGFVMGIAVPTYLDGAMTTDFYNALLIDIGLLSMFAVQHSVMARPGFKKWWTNIIPQPIERSTYVLLSSVCLFLLSYYWQPLGGSIWFIESTLWSSVLLTIGVIGFITVVFSTFLINHFDLFGLRQVWLYFQKKEYTNLPFQLNSLYKYIRHPLYFGFLIAFWSTPTMTFSHLFFAIMCTGYILVGIKLEENDLLKVFGKGYKKYQSKTPMIIPFKSKLNKLESDEIITSVSEK